MDLDVKNVEEEIGEDVDGTIEEGDEEEIEDWEVEEGIPQMSDQFIQRYLQGRDALISQEMKKRSGWCMSLSKLKQIR